MNPVSHLQVVLFSRFEAVLSGSRVTTSTHKSSALSVMVQGMVLPCWNGVSVYSDPIEHHCTYFGEAFCQRKSKARGQWTPSQTRAFKTEFGRWNQPEPFH